MMEQYNRLSGKSQQRIEALQSRADNLFCHQWLRKAMFDELRKQVGNLKNTKRELDSLEKDIADGKPLFSAIS